MAAAIQNNLNMNTAFSYIPFFSGSDLEDISELFDSIDITAIALGWTDDQKLARTPMFLKGHAREMLKTIPAANRDTYNNLKTSLTQIFKRVHNYQQLNLEIVNKV